MLKTAYPYALVKPKVVGLLGQAGSGKDTVASFILDVVEGEGIALADPMKDFAEAVFRFSHDQLRGASAFRNAADNRYGIYDGHNPPLLRLKARDRFERLAKDWLIGILPSQADFDACYSNLLNWFETAIRQPTITPRFVLQTLGTEFGRSVSEDIWIDCGLKRAHQALTEGKWAVIKDIRFLNEARKLRQLGCEVWRINRPNLDNKAVDSAGVSGHASESEQKSPEMDSLVSKELLNSGTLDDLYANVSTLIVS